jgi:hypothetical protein
VVAGVSPAFLILAADTAAATEEHFNSFIIS